jgi:hypothetical protein
MASADDRLTGIETGITEVRTGIALLADEMRLHGELLGRIIEMLTPETEPSGAPLHELIALLIGRLARASRHHARPARVRSANPDGSLALGAVAAAPRRLAIHEQDAQTRPGRQRRRVSGRSGWRSICACSHRIF